jgi:hypothetical protein
MASYPTHDPSGSASSARGLAPTHSTRVINQTSYIYSQICPIMHRHAVIISELAFLRSEKVADLYSGCRSWSGAQGSPPITPTPLQPLPRTRCSAGTAIVPTMKPSVLSALRSGGVLILLSQAVQDLKDLLGSPDWGTVSTQDALTQLYQRRLRLQPLAPGLYTVYSSSTSSQHKQRATRTSEVEQRRLQQQRAEAYLKELDGAGDFSREGPQTPDWMRTWTHAFQDEVKELEEQLTATLQACSAELGTEASRLSTRQGWR